ncbi:MAG: formate dehydrogenase accessory sulfurtransferase FdhD [Spartobacteria bacterium]
MRVTLHDIWISSGHDFKGRHGQGRLDHGMQRLESAECHAGKGLVGDRYYGENPGEKQQITFLSREVVEQMCESLSLTALDCSTLRRNVLVSGVDLNSLIGRQFRLGGLVFEGVEECNPCYWMDEAVAPGANAFLVGRGGLRCRILEDGLIACGEADLETLDSHTRKFQAIRQQSDQTSPVVDSLTVERPLQIIVNGSLFSMTMQTPGAERFLVRGLLHSEAVNDTPFANYEQEETALGTFARVELTSSAATPSNRRLASTSSCGLCGKESMEKMFEGVTPVSKAASISASALQTIHDNARRRQSQFHGTGGCHAASAATANGDVLCIFEDIGRHNAVDKVIGFLLENNLLPLADVLTVSGRVSFEIVQKCARAGIPILSAISAPSSLAVEMSERWGITLAGFCREDRATFYSHTHRVGG